MKQNFEIGDCVYFIFSSRKGHKKELGIIIEKSFDLIKILRFSGGITLYALHWAWLKKL